MRVAVVSDMIRPNGAGVMALLAADVLRQGGHEVVVLGGSMAAELEARLGDENVAAGAFTHDERALDGSVTATDHAAFVRSFRSWLDARLAEHRVDLLYVHNCGRVLTQLDLADLSKRLPVVHTMHDEWFFTDAHYRFKASNADPVTRTFEPGRSDSVIEHRYEHLFDVPGRVGNFLAIGPSKWITDRAQRVFPSVDITQLANAVDTDAFDLHDRLQARESLGLPTDRALVLFVGSPTQERKGFSMFERAMRHATGPDGKPPIGLVAGGQGSLATGGADALLSAGPIAQLVARPTANPVGALGIAGEAVVIAGLARNLMPVLYAAADLLVHPSVIDNLPTVPIEAGLCGTRCLASDVGGTSETIADIDDLFDPQISPDALGRRISDSLASVAAETAEDRQRRRDAQVIRFSIDVHRRALLPLLESRLAMAAP